MKREELNFVAGLQHKNNLNFEKIHIDIVAAWILNQTEKNLLPSIMNAMEVAYDEVISNPVNGGSYSSFLRTGIDDKYYMTCSIGNQFNNEDDCTDIRGRVLVSDNPLWADTARLNHLPTTIMDKLRVGQRASDIVDFAPYKDRNIIEIAKSQAGGPEIIIEPAPLVKWDDIFPGLRPIP